MTYQKVEPPFSLNFWEMKKKDLEQYFEWMRHGSLGRINELQAFVQESANWVADSSPESLLPLGKWFSQNVRTCAVMPQGQEQSLVERQHDLDTQTFSLAFDVGMYLAEVFLRNHPSLSWTQTFGSKTAIDYGQPVIQGFGSQTFNPVRMTVTLAYGLANGQRDADGLKELYDIWSGKVR